MARDRGMTLRLPPVQPRSRLAHEAAAFARPHGKFVAMNGALFGAFFELGEDIGSVNVVAKHAEVIGLDADELRRALDQGFHREQVIADEEIARTLGVHGVPAMLVRNVSGPIERATMIEGAQPYERVLEAIEQLVAELRNP